MTYQTKETRAARAVELTVKAAQHERQRRDLRAFELLQASAKDLASRGQYPSAKHAEDCDPYECFTCGDMAIKRVGELAFVNSKSHEIIAIIITCPTCRAMLDLYGGYARPTLTQRAYDRLSAEFPPFEELLGIAGHA